MAVDVTYQGGKFAQRGYDMYREVERLTPFDIFVSQGGYNVDGVAASAGTHDKEAVDISGSLLTPDQRWTVVTNMRRVGFAAWIRKPPSFSWHIHGVPIGGDLSVEARAQVVQYLNKQNGLKGAGPDDGPTGYYDMTWEKYTGTSAYRPPIDTDGTSEEDDMTPDQAAQLKDVHAALPLIRDLHNAMSALGGTGNADRFRPFFRRASVEGTYDVTKSEGNLGLGAKLDKIMAKLGI